MPENNVNETTSIALSNNVVGKIMTPADFSALDNLIQTLGDKSANLTPDEKTSAIAIVTEWNQSIIERIHANVEQAKIVLTFLNGGQLYGSVLESTIELFHEVIGDSPEYQEYLTAAQNYATVQTNEPIETPISSTMTIAQSEEVQWANRAAQQEHTRALQAASYKLNKAIKAYILYLNSLPEIKTVQGNLTSYKNKARRMETECRDKATKAKLNITIQDKDIRDTLHEMLDFAKTV